MAGGWISVSAVLVLLGAGVGAGILLVVRSLRPEVRSPHTRHLRRRFPDLPRRALQAVAGALCVGLLTRWPVGVVSGGVFGFFASDLFGGRAERNVKTDQTEAIASWTEMLRDTMGAAAGLEQAIVTTAPIAPAPIRPHVQALVARLRREPLAPALHELAESLANPTADLVVAALALAANGEAQDLGDLLGSLARAARDGASMRLRIDASRARTRTSVRIITGVTIAMAALLVVLNRSYLQPFDSAAGQGVLLLVLTFFGGALWWLVRMARYVEPERFLARSGHGRQPWS
jgi:Flp pilus assembly protein TadB